MEKLVPAAPSIQLPSARSAQQSYNLEPRTPARRIPVQEYPKLAHHVTKIQAALQLMSRGPFAGRKVKFPELLYFNPPTSTHLHSIIQLSSLPNMFAKPRPKKSILPPPSKKRKATHTVEEITFDNSARQEYLTGFHKRKVQRQKHAQEEAAKRAREEKIEFRKQVSPCAPYESGTWRVDGH